MGACASRPDGCVRGRRKPVGESRRQRRRAVGRRVSSRKCMETIAEVEIMDGPRNPGSERLAELLRAEISEASSDEAETVRKAETLEKLKRVVGMLQPGGRDNVGGYRRKEAAGEVQWLSKDDAGARETFAMLGAIPPQVGMLDSPDPDFQIVALYALLNLGIDNDLNKATVVKAGAVHKMLSLIGSGSSPTVSEVIVVNFL